MTHIIVVDAETFYDRQFSLSKLTTEFYIRSPQFETIGVSVKLDDRPSQWFSGSDEEIKDWLDQFPWDDCIAVAHNAMFDMAILNWKYDIRPKRIADTLSMARAIDGPDAGNSLAKLAVRYGLGEKGTEVVNALGKRRRDFTKEELRRYGDYCDNDVELTYALFERMAPLLPAEELRLIDVTIRMFTEPVLELDGEKLKTHLVAVKERKEKLLAAVGKDKSELMSNPKFAALLEARNVIPPTKISQATGKETWAFSKTDERFMALQDHPDEVVQALVAARLGTKSTLEETRTERFIGVAGRGSLPVPLRYYGAKTGRWSGEDKFNLQNLPRKSPIKEAIYAPPGYLLVDCDSSQIEARVLAWLAEQEDLVEGFARGEDVYRKTGSKIYGMEEAALSDELRRRSKGAVLGAGYGMGPTRFQKQMQDLGDRLGMEECVSIIYAYRNMYPNIPQLWKQGGHALEALHQGKTMHIGPDDVLTVNALGIRLPNNMYIRYRNLRFNEQGEYIYDENKGRATLQQRIYGPKVVENLCQALARIIIGGQLLTVAKRYKVAMTVHDSIVSLVPEGEAEEGREFIERAMRSPPSWAKGLPLNCESKIGVSYGG